jgi:hypothetical protein
MSGGRRGEDKKEGIMGDFLSFRKMITPVIIQIIFWIGVAAAIVGGIVVLVAADEAGTRVLGLLYMILGPLYWRVFCEIVILFFRMNETLTDIKNNTERK